MNIDRNPISIIRDLLSRSVTVLKYMIVKIACARLDNLAFISCNRTDLYRAEIALRIIARLRPGDYKSMQNLFRLLIETLRFDEAIKLLDSYSSLHGNHELCHAQLINLHTKRGDVSTTMRLLSEISLDTTSPPLQLALGAYHRQSGDLEKAATYFKKANNTLDSMLRYIANVNLANNAIDQNNPEEAVQYLDKAIRIMPRRSDAYGVLARMKYYKTLDHAHIQTMSALLDSGDPLDWAERIDFHFVLGTIFDSLKSYGPAFAHFKAANELKIANLLDPINIATVVDARIQIFDPEFIDRTSTICDPHSGDKLIFIVGMPRSGTTLAEQILASHPAIYAGGERRDVQVMTRRLSVAAERNTPYPECLRSLDRATIDRISRDHLEGVASLVRDERRFVDKAPMNFLEIGLISMLFPRARIIHCHRNAIDTCLSCYFQNFQEILFSCKLSTLGAYYSHYRRLMEHWHLVLPNRIFDLRYEHLINDPRTTTRNLLNYCELPWDERCMDFHETKRVVMTPSSCQIKRPLYSSSMERWKNYRSDIQELLSTLGHEL